MKAIDKAMTSGASALVLAMYLTAPSAGHAQTTAANASPASSLSAAEPTSLGEVVVTARKRAERLIDVPVAITAFTGNDLLARDITTLADLANFTPGLEDDIASAGGARVDRSSELFITRGLTQSNSLNPTTSVFLNSVPIGASDFLQTLDDIDHVEVLKGPQSAYFGRETFAGAVNAVAKSAGNTLTGDLNSEVGTRDTYRFSGSVTVPLIDNMLSVRAGYYYDSHNGSYKNTFNPSQTLGDESTTSEHVAITFKPIQNLTIKAFGMIFHDEDGPEATGLLLANGPAAYNQANCKVATTGASNNFFCGTLPGLISSVSPAEVTTVTAAEKAFFSNPGGIIRPSEIIHGFGLRRDAYHGDINVEYAIPKLGLTLTYLGGFNRDNYSSVSDLANIDGGAGGQYPGYAGFPYLVEDKNHDYSHELRIASDPNQPFRALIGVSYLDVYHDAINYSLGGTKVAPAPLGAATPSETSGVFFSFAYDFLAKFTLNFDGRFQSDKEKSLTTTNVVAAQGTTHDFLPRVSLQYKVMRDVMAYATYSQGVNPGVFNTQYNTLPAASQQELAASGSAGLLAVKPEKITNYELGLKGRFWHDRAMLSADVYYDDWTDQINPSVYYFSPTDPANPYNVNLPTNILYKPNFSSQYVYSDNNNSASTHAKGVEIQGDLIPIEHVTINASGAYSEARYSTALCTSCAPYPTAIATAPNVGGKYLPYSPKYSATVGVQYSNNFTYLPGADWFARVDYIYRDGVFIQETNTVKTPDINLVNLRGGVNWKNVTLEGFVNNLFNDKAYTTGFEDVNFAGGFAPAVMVGLPTLITGGVRVRAHF